MSAEKIINDWKKKLYKPVYWLEGEEEYFIDKIVDFAEHHILDPSEASFNLSVFYGKDALPDVRGKAGGIVEGGATDERHHETGRLRRKAARLNHLRRGLQRKEGRRA
jgi:hypothetical protein